MTIARHTLQLSLTLAALLISVSAAQAQRPMSGMLLGVNAFENWRGMRVTSTIPGYSAEGRLFAGDVLLQVADDYGVYSARRRYDFEMAKDRIGPQRWAALEVFRPNVGIIHFWVQFQPVDDGIGGPLGPAAAPGNGNGGAAPARAMRAEIRTEQERPNAGRSARSLFDNLQQQLNPAPRGGRPMDVGSGQPTRNRRSGQQNPLGRLDPRSLFNR